MQRLRDLVSAGSTKKTNTVVTHFCGIDRFSRRYSGGTDSQRQMTTRIRGACLRVWARHPPAVRLRAGRTDHMKWARSELPSHG